MSKTARGRLRLRELRCGPLVVFPSGLPRAVVKLTEAYFAALKAGGTTHDVMIGFEALQKRCRFPVRSRQLAPR